MAAAAADDFSAFERAESARLEGKPLERQKIAVDVAPAAGTPASRRPNAEAGPAKPAAAKPAAAAAGTEAAAVAAAAAEEASPENRKTRQERDQQRINDAIRMGIEAGLAAHGVKIAPAPGSAEATAAAAAAAAKDTPAWKRYQAMEGFPKLEEFESLAEHSTAAAVFVAGQMLEEQRTAAARTDLDREVLTVAQKRVDTFLSRLETRKTADPEWIKAIAPEVIALKPFGALQEGEVAGPENFVAEELMDSEVVDQMMVALSKPGELARITAMPPLVAAIQNPVAQKRAHMQHMRRLLWQLEGRLIDSAASAGATAQQPAVPSKPPIAAAPAPADTISRPGSVTNPRQAAIDKGDFAEFDRIETATARAKLAR